MHNKLYNADHKERLSYVIWYLQWGAYKRNRPPTLILFSWETWFQLSRQTKSQNIMFLMLIHKVPLHGIQAGVWYVECNRINALFFFPETIYTHWHVTNIM